MTKVELKFISDADMYLFFGSGMRGRVFSLSNRYSQANNTYLNLMIIYSDANSLYDYVMSKFLSESTFKWINSKNFDLNNYNKNSSKSFVLEVDFEYPKILRELNNSYPVAQDKIDIRKINDA